MIGMISGELVTCAKCRKPTALTAAHAVRKGDIFSRTLFCGLCGKSLYGIGTEEDIDMYPYLSYAAAHNQVEKLVIYDANENTDNGESAARYLVYVVRNGCESGVVSRLIYDRDCHVMHDMIHFSNMWAVVSDLVAQAVSSIHPVGARHRRYRATDEDPSHRRAKIWTAYEMSAARMLDNLYLIGRTERPLNDVATENLIEVAERIKT